jgi:hypothetical protein
VSLTVVFAPTGAFGLASLLIGVLAVLLAVSSAGEYLGLERPVDDQVDLEGGKDDLTTSILQRVFRAEEAAKVAFEGANVGSCLSKPYLMDDN